MSHPQLAQLTAFLAVAEHLSFSKAAVQVGIAAPTMSQNIRSFEDRLGVRLFNRTTRSVALTEAGQRLLAEIKPIVEGIDHAFESVNFFRDKPMGTLRLVVSRPTTTRLLAPLLQPFLAEYPAIRLEIVVDDMHGDIISGRFDAGIHIGHRIDRDMTILRLTEDLKMLTVSAPSYMGERPVPSAPKDLHALNCIRYRLPWDGSIQPWTFGNGGSQIEIGPAGSLTVNDLDLLLSATLDGIGICHVAEPLAAPYLAQGRLVELLVDWTSTLSGVFLYYPSRRQPPMPLQVFLAFVKKWQKCVRAVERVSGSNESPCVDEVIRHGSLKKID